MDASDIIASVALAFSLASAVAAGVSLYLGFREAGRREEEIALLREEAGRRDQEVALLGTQLAEEREERRQLLRAVLDAEPLGGGSSSSRGIEFRVEVSNAGPHVARRVGVRLHDSAGTRIGTTTRAPRLLMPGESQTLTLHLPPSARMIGPFGLSLEWYDGRGFQEGELADFRLQPP